MQLSHHIISHISLTLTTLTTHTTMKNKAVTIQDPEVGLNQHDSRDTVSLNDDSRSHDDDDNLSRPSCVSTVYTRESNHLINDEDGTTIVSPFWQYISSSSIFLEFYSCTHVPLHHHRSRLSLPSC
jgi:hypothetical protein